MIRECAALLFYVPAAAVQWWGAPRQTFRASYKMSVMLASSGLQVLMSARMSLYSCWLLSLVAAAAVAYLKLFSVCKETKKNQISPRRLRHLIDEREHAKCTCAVLGNALKTIIRGSAAAWGSTLVGARGPGGDGYFGGKNFRSNL